MTPELSDALLEVAVGAKLLADAMRLRIVVAGDVGVFFSHADAEKWTSVLDRMALVLDETSMALGDTAA